MDRPPRIWTVIGGTGILFLWWLHQDLIITQNIIDDAYISYRYAENVASGSGLVFNPGDRVEGFTNLLWVLVLALVASVGVSLPLAAVTMTKVSVLVLLVGTMLVGLGSHRERHPLWALMAPLLLAMSGPVVVWGVSGMETVPYAQAVLACAGSYLARWQSGYRTAAVLGFGILATLLRPEGAALLLWYTGLIAGERWHHNRRDALALLGGAGGFLAALTFWRLLYFGAPVPNTFYAKTGGGLQQLWSGLSYTGSYLGYYAPIAIGSLVCWWFAARRDRRLTMGVALPVLGLLTVNVLVGGDWMPFYRFQVPVMVLQCLLLQEALWRLVRLERLHPHLAGGTALGVAALTLLLSFSPHHVGSLRFENRLSLDRIQIGHWLREEAVPGDSIAIGAIGIVPFISGLRTYDPHGLIHPEISRQPMGAEKFRVGHARLDYDWVLDQRPTFIIPFAGLMPEVPSRGELKEIYQLPEWGRLADLPKLQREYVYRTHQIGRRYLAYYERKDRNDVIFFEEPRVKMAPPELRNQESPPSPE